ncbi:MAG: HipA domain-containing protein [Eubacterium sp.]
MTEFYIRLVFCFIVGNSDMHLKNFSLLETAESS